MYGSEKVKAFITNMTAIFHWTPNYLPPVPKINLYISSILVIQFPLFSLTFFIVPGLLINILFSGGIWDGYLSSLFLNN